ncbi:BadF/BadG/BcrA/BcrD ATPase family protein [Prosthecomicrobium sp. N25]|uniref:BadF/BadG/BcrA/BcrD ATPase family protein n=1 Tax=Prosthecomicrobium sp. N25 TaxID=3129254 RepID=UPI003076B83B
MLTLGLDAGGSATRWVLLEAEADRVVARGEVGPFSGHIFDPAVERRCRSAVAAVAAAALPHAPSRVAGGITGLGGGSPEAATIARWLAEALGLPEEAVTLGDDMWVPAASLFAPGAGGIVYAGTGSVGYAIDREGRAVKVGGRGVVIDDAGGAYWIAVRGLRAVARALDEDADRHPALRDALAARLGVADWPTIRAAVYAADRGGVAALAPFVADAARAGDAAALAILEDAGAELARLGEILARRLGLTDLALLGNAVRLHPAIAVALRRHLPAGLALATPEIDAAHAAARLAALGRAAPTGT